MERETIELFAVMNSLGQYFRAKGYSGYGETWVDSLEKARFYSNIGPAKAQVTYFSKHWTEYPVPKIIIVEVKVKEVIDQEDRVKGVIEKGKRSSYTRKITSLKDNITRSKTNLERAKRDLLNFEENK